MKYRIRQAIKKSSKREDLTISKDALQNELGISRYDEVEWIFNKVEILHDKKLGWKQIIEYLKKTLTVRANINDFFTDKKRDKEYENNKAEQMVHIERRQMKLLSNVANLDQNKSGNSSTNAVNLLKKTFVKNCKMVSERLIYNEFKYVIRNVYYIDIKEHNLGKIWDYLMLEENTQINMNVFSDYQSASNIKEESLGIEFLIKHIEANVENWNRLSAKQILQLAFVEFILNVSENDNIHNHSNDEEHINNDMKILQEMKNMQRQFKEQNDFLLQELHSLKNKLNQKETNEKRDEMHRANSIDMTSLTD